jgi:SAM-dependent methyltransferase
LIGADAEGSTSVLHTDVLKLVARLHEELRRRADQGCYHHIQTELQGLHRLQRTIEQRLDVTQWRLSPAHAEEQFRHVDWAMRCHALPLRGAVHVDIGCGAVLPYGRMFVHLMAGAAQAFCFDLDQVADEASACRALAGLAAAALLDPTRVFGSHRITREQILHNLHGFDLARLAAGDVTGIAKDRLQFLRRSVDDLGLPTGSVDAVFSNSVLEHLPDVGAALAENARVLRPGGFAVHGIDTKDHRWYGNPKFHPLEFLTEPEGPRIVYGCNRLRIHDYLPLFRAAGFVSLDEAWVGGLVEITPELRRRLQPPWSVCSDAELSRTWRTFLLRRDPQVA